MQVMESTDGEHFSGKIALRESSDFAPAVVLNGAKELLLAWTARNGANALNMMSGPSLGQLSHKEAAKEYSAASAPVFAAFQGKTFVAWRSRGHPFRVNLAAVGARKSFGNSFVKLKKDLSVLDWFTQWNADDLSNRDIDLGSAGVLLMPKTNLLVGAGKEGRLFLLDRDRMGGFCADCNSTTGETKIVQSFLLPGYRIVACSPCPPPNIPTATIRSRMVPFIGIATIADLWSTCGPRATSCAPTGSTAVASIPCRQIPARPW